LTLSRHSTNCAEKSCTGAYQTPAQKENIAQPFFVARKTRGNQLKFHVISKEFPIKRVSPALWWKELGLASLH